MLNECDTVHGPLEFQKAVNLVTMGKDAKVITPTEPYFLPNTELPMITINFLFQGAGMGDYICYMPAIIWNAKNCPWVDGKLYVPHVFLEFAQNIMKPYSSFEVLRAEEINYAKQPSLMRAPGITMNGVKYAQIANGCGGHLVDLGFLYYVNKFPTPQGADLFPEIDFGHTETRLPDGLSPNSYVVLTPGGVSENRTVPGEAWNPIIDYLQKRGITPVVLGKTKLGPNFFTKFPPGMDWDRVINLVDKTTMIEAAWIMKNAAATLGLDNGLIHLAACTDAPIIAAYSMVNPRDRRPNRRAGKWEEIFVSKEELPCTGCQSEMANMFPHTFNRCLYGHSDCIKLIFKNKSERWIQAMDRIIP